MQTQLLGLTAALTVVAITSGCGLTGTSPSEPSPQAGEITIGGKTRETKSVECTQMQWSLTIDANAEPGRADAYLQIGGANPVVDTIHIENIDGMYGVVGGDLGDAEATFDGNIYTIRGTAVGSDSGAKPGQSRTLPFEIKAPC
jgi:ipoprotein LpqH